MDRWMPDGQTSDIQFENNLFPPKFLILTLSFRFWRSELRRGVRGPNPIQSSQCFLFGRSRQRRQQKRGIRQNLRQSHSRGEERSSLHHAQNHIRYASLIFEARKGQDRNLQPSWKGPAEIHDLVGEEAQFLPTNHLVDDNNCSQTSPGTKCPTYILHTQDFDRLGGHNQSQISPFFWSHLCHTSYLLW